MGGRVQGKMAMVTGGASGLGTATCRLLVAEGARVAVADINLKGAQAVADAINKETPGSAVAIVPQALERARHEWDMLKCRVAADSLVDALQDNGEPARMNPVVAPSMPVIGFVERLDDGNLFLEHLENRHEVLDVAINPMMTGHARRRLIAEVIPQSLVNGLIADQGIDLQTLASETADEFGVSLLPGTTIDLVLITRT